MTDTSEQLRERPEPDPRSEKLTDRVFQRIRDKPWLKAWPELRIVEDGVKMTDSDQLGMWAFPTPTPTRVRFEAWILREASGYSLVPADPDRGTYKELDTEALWKAWQASAKEKQNG